MRTKSIWIQTPTGGFLWDSEREQPHDPVFQYDEEQPSVYAELPVPRPKVGNEDPYRPQRGVVVL